MAKPRHDEPTSSKTTMAVLIAGGLLVAALLVWALTRTVEPETPPAVPVADATTFSAPVPADTTGTAPGVPVGTDTSLTLPPATPVEGSRAEVKRMAVEDLRGQLNRGDVTVIDVRTAADYAQAHIPGAINIPFASIETQLDSIPRGKPIVTYCTWPAEESSAGAALILQNKGVTNVSALFGGFDAWRSLGYPTVSGIVPQ